MNRERAWRRGWTDADETWLLRTVRGTGFEGDVALERRLRDERYPRRE